MNFQEYYGISRNFKDYLCHLGSPMSCDNSSSHLITCHFSSWKSHVMRKICLPISLPIISHLGRPISCGKCIFPSHYLPLFILEVPCYSMWKIRLPISLPANSYLGLPISCGKFVFPSHYLQFFILEVPCHEVLQRYFQVSPKLLGFGEACPGVLKVSCCGVASWALRNLATSVSMIWICFKIM